MFMGGGAVILALLFYVVLFAVLVLAVAMGVVLGLRYDRLHRDR